MHPAWFKEDLERLFGLLATRVRVSRTTVAALVTGQQAHLRLLDQSDASTPSSHVSLSGSGFDEVAKAHRRLEAGGLEGKLVLCPEPSPFESAGVGAA
jgi:hypothetical protein